MTTFDHYRALIITCIICAIMIGFIAWILICHFFKKDIDRHNAKRLYIKGKCDRFKGNGYTRYYVKDWNDIISCDCNECKYCNES